MSNKHQQENKDIRTLNDLLNKYKSELSELKRPKLSKTINVDKIRNCNSIIDSIKHTIILLKLYN